jgi:hypothetical protein
MNNNRQMNDTDEELIDTLLAISVVSKRLARNLTLLTAQSKSTEGGKTNEQNERDVRDNRRTAQMCATNSSEFVLLSATRLTGWQSSSAAMNQSQNLHLPSPC